MKTNNNICFNCGSKNPYLYVCLYDDIHCFDNYEPVCGDCFYNGKIGVDEYLTIHFSSDETGYVPASLESELSNDSFFEEINGEYYAVDYVESSKDFVSDYLLSPYHAYIPKATDLYDHYENRLGWTMVDEEELWEYGFDMEDGVWKWQSDCIYDYHAYDADDYKFLSLENELPVYFGVEIETEGSVENADLVDENLFHCEYDGSLHSGFEIISHPMTYGYWLSKYNDIKRTLEGLKKCNQTADEEQTCGLHIHVSRKAFKNEEAIRKVIAIVSGFKENIVMLARRNENEYCCYEDVICPSGKVTKDIDLPKDRKRAVNTTKDETIEFRMFQSTLNADILYASIEFIINIICSANEETDTVMFEDLLKGRFLKEYALGLKLNRKAKIEYEEED